MKEITAILRPRKDRETKQALSRIGVTTCTMRRVFGRGRQRGLRYSTDPASVPAVEQVAMRYLPKKMLYLVVTDQQARAAVQTIIRVNQTGQYGDGKIFVSDCEAVRRIRTGEEGDMAAQ